MRKKKREREIANARAILGDERLMTFLRQCRSDSGLRACGEINEELDRVQSLDAIFYTGGRFGYELAVKQAGPNRFAVSFGCLVDPEVGDGGEWVVTFTPAGEIQSFEPGEQWIS